jgi:hypothetical protein
VLEILAKVAEVAELAARGVVGELAVELVAGQTSAQAALHCEGLPLRRNSAPR